MAEKPEKKNKPVSPVNGQPVPRGRQFTSETAREARAKRTAKERQAKSIKEAFVALMEREFTDEKGLTKTGAELMAQAILKGAVNGNAKMVDIALALMDETPLPPGAW